MKKNNCIIFVGDKPSKKNKHPNIPFVGTKSYKTLLGWIADMDIDIHTVYLINRTDHSFKVWMAAASLNRTAAKVVALGREAARAVEGAGLPYFQLPHPSPKNRLLNDKKQIRLTIKECKEWLERKKQ